MPKDGRKKSGGKRREPKGYWTILNKDTYKKGKK